MKHIKQSILSKDGINYLIPFILITSCFALWGFANDIDRKSTRLNSSH